MSGRYSELVYQASLFCLVGIRFGFKPEQYKIMGLCVKGKGHKGGPQLINH